MARRLRYPMIVQFEQEMSLEGSFSTIATRARALQEMLREAHVRKLTLRETDALVVLTQTLQSVLDTRKQEASVKFIPWGFAL